MIRPDVYIIDGCRTPFLKAQGRPGPFSASDLAVGSAMPLLLRQPFDPRDLDEVIVGAVAPGVDEANIARIIALRLGCGYQVPAWSVQRNCASGLQAIDSALTNLVLGRSELVLAGGTEAMSHAPVLHNRQMVNWLANLNRAKSAWGKIRTLTEFRPGHLVPVFSLLKGLSDPIVGLSMGQTAENLVHRFGISRLEMDRFAVASHQRTLNAQNCGYLEEIEPIYDHEGNYYSQDDGVRSDSDIEKLARLKPVFDRKFGNVTAGNSAQITDGAAWVILASESAVNRHQLSPMGRIVAINWAALDPAKMGLGPVHATAPMLMKEDLRVTDIDYWEINEAFAAQVLSCIAAFRDDEYCKSELGLDEPLGEISLERLNVDGGAISMGHPVGASGTRIAYHLLKILSRNQARLGVATLCIGGGQGGAILVENLQQGLHDA